MFPKAIYFVVLLCLAQSRLVQPSDGREAVVGQDVILKCRTGVDGSPNPEWRRTIEGQSFEIIYKSKYINKRFKDRFQVVSNETTGDFDLLIKQVQLDDAGRYTCSNQHVQLIVFDRYPSNEFCTTTSTLNGNQNRCGFESVTLSCALRYKGNLTPTLEWREGENRIHSTVTTINGLNISSIQLTEGQLQKAKYTCSVKYPPSTLTSRYTWSSNLNFTPKAAMNNLSYEGCDLKTIECSDGESPDCKYAWTDGNGTQLSSSWSMEMSGKPSGNYTCLATCNVHSTSCSYVARIFNYRCHDYKPTSELPSTTSTPGTTIGQLHAEHMELSLGITSPEIYAPVVISAFVILAVVIILVVLFLRRSRKSRTREVHHIHVHVNDPDAETGQINKAIESTQSNGTKSQETEIMLKENALYNDATNIY